MTLLDNEILDENDETENEEVTVTPTFSELAGLPDMNIVHTHSDPAKNDVEDIIQAIYINLDQDEPQAPGHSPADRLVIAVAKLNNVDPDTALYTGNYPNQMKRIAAIIRGDFDSESEENLSD